MNAEILYFKMTEEKRVKNTRIIMMVTRILCSVLILAMLAGCVTESGKGGSSVGVTSSKGSSTAGASSFGASSGSSSESGGGQPTSSTSSNSNDQPVVTNVGWEPVGMINEKMIQAGVAAGEAGQWVLSVTYSYSDPNICWLGTDVGGIYRSTDGGENWVPMTVGMSSEGGRGIAVDPTNSKRVLVVGGNGTAKECDGMYLSTNGGETFTLVQASKVHGWRDNRVQIAYDYTSYDKKLGYCTTVYWSRETLKYEESSYTGYRGGAENSPALFKSTDGGKSWKVINTSEEIGGAQLATDAKSGALFAACKNGLFRSTDGGKSFKKVISGIASSVNTVITKPGHVWATCQDGLYYSTNGGDSFSKITSKGYPTNLYPVVAVSPADPNYMIVGTDEKTWLFDWGKTCKYFYSTDGGKTFEPCKQDLTVSFFRNSNAQISISMHPTDKNKSIINGGFTNFISTDAGKTYLPKSQGYIGACWTSISFNVNNPDMFAVSNQDNMGAFTLDGGKTWKSLCSTANRLTQFTYGCYVLDEKTSFFIARDDNNQYKQGKGAYVMMRSVDGGNIYKPCNVNFTGNTYVTGVIGNNNIVLAGNMRTTDRGDTWQKMAGVDKVLAVDYKTKALYGVYKKILVKSTDEGASWQGVCSVPTSSSIKDLSVGADGSVWLVDTSKVYKVTDGKCSTVGTVGYEGRVNTIACDPNNATVAYVGCRYVVKNDRGGVFRTTDGGKSWQLINKTVDNGMKGLDGVSGSTWMRCHPKTGYLYTIGSCRGMWRIAPPTK